MATRSWNKDRAAKRIDGKIADLPVKDIQIKEYVRDTDLTNLPSNVAYRVNGVHLYADIRHPRAGRAGSPGVAPIQTRQALLAAAPCARNVTRGRFPRASRSARRSPLNAPCLSLRFHPGTPDDVIEEASACRLSGGGHPFLINDDKMVSGLLRCGMGAGGNVSAIATADARDMVCDGCFESLFAGKCEFAFC